MPLFKKLAIIGPGLIGSSLLRRAKEKGDLAEKLIAIDHNPEVIKRVKELALADNATSSLEEGVKNADLIILCIPVGAIKEIAKKIIPFLKKDAILSDVASVRGTLGEDIQKILPPTLSYIPAHPMAGTEYSGPDAGLADLFENRWCLLTPPENTHKEAIQKMHLFWQRCGARTRQITPQYHDQVCAMVSHLPHLLAFTICDTAANLSHDLRTDVLEYAASGFRDFTRIAASDPIMWRDIFLSNQDILLQTLDLFQAEITKMTNAIRQNNGEVISERIARGRHIRQTLINNRQA